MADLWTGFDAVADTVDGVHPNDTGFQKMADAWYPVVARVLGGAVPTASPSPTRTASPTPTATGGEWCAANYTVTSQWGGSFQGEVTVTNTSGAPSSAWTVTFGFANGQQLIQAWNASYTQSGSTVTVRNVSYNGGLPACGSTTFGFIATWNNGTNAAPAVTCVLG